MRLAHNRLTKIVATIGPATMDAPEPEKALSELVEAGVDVFRFNFSHDPHDLQQKKYDLVRKMEEKYDRTFGVIADMQGPKLRVGRFKNDKITLKTGQDFRVDMNEEPGDETRVCLPHPELFASAAIGTEILLDDGKLKIVVKELGADYAVCKVAVGGELKSRKGFNVPNAILKLSAITEKDKKDIEYALKMGADYIAISFVQQPKDVEEVRKIIGKRALIITKVEKPSAVTHIEKITEFSDVIMVARGDLAVETSHEKMPILRRKIMLAARRQGKPVIMATQMLESMTEAPVPTRAEVSDVASAVYEGADAVMLSAESASGKFPTEAVRTMANIIAEVEADEIYSSQSLDLVNVLKEKVENRDDVGALCAAATKLTQDVDIKAFAAYTYGGSTAATMSRFRPSAPILAITCNLLTARKLAVYWGVNRMMVKEPIELSAIESKLAAFLKKEGMAKEGDLAAIIAGQAIAHSLEHTPANLLMMTKVN